MSSWVHKHCRQIVGSDGFVQCSVLVKNEDGRVSECGAQIKCSGASGTSAMANHLKVHKIYKPEGGNKRQRPLSEFFLAGDENAVQRRDEAYDPAKEYVLAFAFNAIPYSVCTWCFVNFMRFMTEMIDRLLVRWRIALSRARRSRFQLISTVMPCPPKPLSFLRR